jgi:hypothetical protein
MDIMDALPREISREAQDAEWDVAHRQLVSEMKADEGESEGDVLAEAVRLTR